MKIQDNCGKNRSKELNVSNEWIEIFIDFDWEECDNDQRETWLHVSQDVLDPDGTHITLIIEVAAEVERRERNDNSTRLSTNCRTTIRG